MPKDTHILPRGYAVSQSNDGNSGVLRKQGIYLSDESIDVSAATWDQSLSQVVVDESTGELCASIDRMLFESPTEIGVRFLEPHGFNLNLENLLACLDSMRVGVVAKVNGSKRPDGKLTAKKIAPAMYMRLPVRTAKGPLLSRFYEEISKYEAELTRLQQYEAQSRRAMQAAVKDESGRAAVLQLQRDNEMLRDEVERLSRKVGQLTAAIESVPIHSHQSTLPPGVRLSTVRQIKEQDNLVFINGESGQYSFPLSRLNGIPTVGSRALAMHEGGVVRGVWVFDPAPRPFQWNLAEVLFSDGGRIKVRTVDRTELILEASERADAVRRGDQILLQSSGDVVIAWHTFTENKNSRTANHVYDEQTQLNVHGLKNYKKKRISKRRGAA